MYKNHLKVQNTPKGLGVFTEVNIPANSPILEFTGDYYNDSNLPTDQDMILQIGPNFYMGPSGDTDDIINHSCDPNCFLFLVGKRVILYSLYKIMSGTELTYDYSLSSTDTPDEWSMKCNCGSFKCRKNISGFQGLQEDLKKDYLKKGIVPLFISDLK